MNTSRDAEASDNGLGQRIVDRAIEAYGRCTTYADDGEYVLESPRHADVGPVRDVLPFRTRFVRPGRILYMFRSHRRPGTVGEPPPALAFWNGGQPERTPIRWWWNLAGRIEESQDAQLPISAATGIGGNTAMLVVPTLLALDELPSLLEGLIDVRAVGPEELDVLGERRTCNMVTARHLADPEQELRLGFDATSGLLVRVQQRSRDEIETTTLRPRIDEPIADHELVFEPPADVRGHWWARAVRRVFMS